LLLLDALEEQVSLRRFTPGRAGWLSTRDCAGKNTKINKKFAFLAAYEGSGLKVIVILKKKQWPLLAISS